MSEPPPTTPQPQSSLPPLLPPPSHHSQLLPSASSSIREYRKGNWTIQETLILITAKRLDDERRSKPTGQSPSKPGELRWKWVENYCWAHGCFRSQNQCNDKWDNLLRDYKKVREYQSRSNGSDSMASYWTMERPQRKEHNLPSNMSLEVFEALNEVVQRRYTKITTTQQQQQQLFIAHSPTQVTIPAGLPAPETEPPAVSEPSESTSGTESSDKLDTEKKRRKVRNVCSSITQSASILAEAIRSSEEKKEKRHREVMEFEERKLKIEEDRNEVNQQGIASLIQAVTNLSSAIQSLVSDRT